MKQGAEEGEETPALPGTTYNESWQMDLGNETVHLSYYGPAHTSGDWVIYVLSGPTWRIWEISCSTGEDQSHILIVRPELPSITG
ncbi:MAG: hypothetical protein U5K69_01680 [Balneolaceae bacterium]|nr:hypothetical protein [Balneolaceae bacterium]